jgi:hypothetical protein
VRLLYVALGLGVLRNILEASRLSWTGSAGFVLLITLPVFAIGLLLIHMIRRGENWARITFLVAFILVFPLIILFLAFSAANPIYGLLGLGQILLPIIALIFLFQKPSSAWFRNLKTRKRKAHRRRFPPQLTYEDSSGDSLRFPTERQEPELLNLKDSPSSRKIPSPRQQPIAEEKVPEVNYYQILELQPGAPREAIQKAHMALVKVWSQEGFQNDPNIQEIANQRLEEIHSAYEKLMAFNQGRALGPEKKAPAPPSFREPSVGTLRPEGEGDYELDSSFRSDKKS